MLFPADDVLIARGKYSTLGKERRIQLERVQKICSTIFTEANQVLKDCEQIPPSDSSHIANLEACLDHLQDGRQRLVELCAEMMAEKMLAWPE